MTTPPFARFARNRFDPQGTQLLSQPLPRDCWTDPAGTRATLNNLRDPAAIEIHQVRRTAIRGLGLEAKDQIDTEVQAANLHPLRGIREI